MARALSSRYRRKFTNHLQFTILSLRKSECEGSLLNDKTTCTTDTNCWDHVFPSHPATAKIAPSHFLCHFVVHDSCFTTKSLTYVLCVFRQRLRTWSQSRSPLLISIVVSCFHDIHTSFNFHMFLQVI